MNQQWTPPVPISKLDPLPMEVLVGSTATLPALAKDIDDPTKLKTYGMTLEQIVEALGGGLPIPSMHTRANLEAFDAVPVEHPISGPFKQALLLVKADVGLGNVDNTADIAKPVSNPTWDELDLKAPLASPALTGIPTGPTAAPGTNTSQLASTGFVAAAVSAVGANVDDNSITNAKLAPASANTVKANLTAGLANPTDVPATSLPISTAMQAALDAKLNTSALIPATETAAGVVELADNAESAALAINNRALTPAGLGSFNATVSTRGITRLANVTETKAIADAGLAVTPWGLGNYCYSDTWVPGTSLLVNLDNAPTSLGFEFQRIGNWVFFSGAWNVNPTAAVPTLTSFIMGLATGTAVPANFTAVTQAHGTVAGGGPVAESGHVEAQIGGTNLKVEFMAYSAANHKISVTGSYRI